MLLISETMNFCKRLFVCFLLRIPYKTGGEAGGGGEAEGREMREREMAVEEQALETIYGSVAQFLSL